MRKIDVLCVGKNQQDYIKKGLELFEKKLKRYCKFNIQYIKEANYHSGKNNKWLEEEGNRISKYILNGGYTIACDENGKSFNSVAFADKLMQCANQGFSHLQFIIGGPYGLSEKIKADAHLRFSLSAMTLTHQMIRLILIEQIYRAITIINNEKYHHA